MKLIGMKNILRPKNKFIISLWDYLTYSRKKKNLINRTTENGVLGPTFFEGLTIHIDNPKDLHSHEWRRKLKTKTGQTKFKIKYYGELHNEYKNLIIRTDFAPSLVFAIDKLNGEEILLFDGCTFGYDNIFCETYTKEQITERHPKEFYKDKNGNDTFEIIISTYNGIQFDEEMGDEVDENGFIEIINGNKMEFEKVKRNAFDTLQVWAINERGVSIDIIAEELA